VKALMRRTAKAIDLTKVVKVVGLWLSPRVADPISLNILILGLLERLN